MPHFVIDCSSNVLEQQTPQAIMSAVYETAESSGLFTKGDIKVRIRSFEHYQLGEGKNDFLHIFGFIMEGRSKEQKAGLSRSIVERLNQLLPELSVLSMNIEEFEFGTYCNKALLHPDNTGRNRHFQG